MRFLACCLGLLIAVGSLQAASVEGRLIRASETGEGDENLKEITPKLKKIFGFEHYKQLGKDSRELKGQDVVRLDVGEGFTLFCRFKSADDKSYMMDVDIYSGPTLLVKQKDLQLRPKHFVFIKGPEVGSDWLIVAMRVNE